MSLASHWAIALLEVRRNENAALFPLEQSDPIVMDEHVLLSAHNPFAQLADPAIVLAVHQRIGERIDLERQVHLKMDAPPRGVSSEQAAFDASVEAQEALNAARAKTRPATKPRGTGTVAA